MNNYQKNGFVCLEEFVISLADDFDLSSETVWALSEAMRPEDGYDVLVDACERQADLEWA